MAKQAEKRERRDVDASDWVQSVKLGSNHAIKLPQGVSLFNPRKAATWFLEMIPYDVGQNNPDHAPGDYYFKRKYRTHRVPGRGAENPVFCCPKNWGMAEVCSVCQQASSLSQDPKAKDLAKAIAARNRSLWLPYVWEEKEKGVQVWDISDYLFGDNLAEKINKADPDMRPKYMKFASPDNGWTLRVCGVEKAMPGGGDVVHYTDIEFRPRKSPVPDKLLNHGICLDDLLVKVPDSILQDAFLLGSGNAQVTSGWDPNRQASTNGRDEAPSFDETTPSARTREAEPDPQPPSRPEPAAGVSSNGDSGGDDGWDSAPEKPKEELVIAKGETYSFEYEGKVITGDVVDINRAKGLAKVKSPDREGHYVVDLGDLRLPEPKSAKTQPPPAEEGWGDEPPQETTPRRGKK